MKKSIVLIDKNRNELRLMKEAYAQTNYKYRLKEYTDADKAFEYIRKSASEIFIIICDIDTAGVKELLKKIHENNEVELELIPFIFLSNSVLKIDIERASRLSLQGYFQKPMTEEKMVELLKGIFFYWGESQQPLFIREGMLGSN